MTTSRNSTISSLAAFHCELVDVADQYHFAHRRSLISARQYRPAYELVRKHVSPAKKVLDWGAGNGHFSYFLMRFGYEAFGFDFDGVPQVCRGLWPESYKYRQGVDPVSLPFEDDEFDAVTSIGVLGHVLETGGSEPASLREIRRILKPNGVFICVHFPNRFSFIEALARGTGRSSHRVRYTKSDILQLTMDAGLRVIGTGRYGALPRNLWSKELLHRFGNLGPIAVSYELIDKLLTTIARPVCQNHWFVAKA